ncbi:hypothetical protein OROMI_019853 [Orobanche minor]
MAEDEHFVSSSNSGGSGGGIGGAGVGGGVSSNRSKTVKQKKIPQRGLGVAQLEKLRLEEQRKKREALRGANALANNVIVSSGSDSVQCPNDSYRSTGPCGPVQITNDGVGVGGGEIRLQGVCSWPRLWNGECNNVEGGDHVGFSFGYPHFNVNLQYEPSNASVLALSGGVPQRSYQFQRPPPSMMNASSGISPSSVSSPQIEPPSIQSVRSSNYTPSPLPDDDKIAIGMKRSYPFSLESQTMPSFLGNLHCRSYSSSRSRSDEYPSCSTELRNKYIRDGPVNSTTVPEQNTSEDVSIIGDFLTLAPPEAASLHLNTKNKHPFHYLGHQVLDLSDTRSSSSQENIKSSQTDESAPPREQPFSFFPIKLRSDIRVRRNGSGENGEIIDLTLKL